MPQNITKIADYDGWFDAPLGNVEDYFNEVAFKIEKDILRGKDSSDFGLLGDQVYIALMADLDINNEPQTAPYINLIDGVNYTANNGEATMFCGLREMLKYFVYAEYIKDNRLTNFQSGTVNIDQENAVNAERKEVHRKAHKRWNNGVDLFNGEVYDYILFYQSSFTNWNFTQQSKYLTLGIK